MSGLEKRVENAIRERIVIRFSEIANVMEVTGVEDAARAALRVVREELAEPTAEVLNAMVNAGMSADKVYRAAIAAIPLGNGGRDG